MIWSDETRISILAAMVSFMFGVDLVTGEECLPECLLPTMKHPVAVMIWGCMSWNGIGRMQVVIGTLSAARSEQISTK